MIKTIAQICCLATFPSPVLWATSVSDYRYRPVNDYVGDMRLVQFGSCHELQAKLVGYEKFVFGESLIPDEFADKELTVDAVFQRVFKEIIKRMKEVCEHLSQASLDAHVRGSLNRNLYDITKYLTGLDPLKAKE